MKRYFKTNLPLKVISFILAVTLVVMKDANWF